MAKESNDPFKLDDPEVQWALALFRTQIPPSQWLDRTRAIEQYMHEVLKPKARYVPNLPMSSISYKQDKIGWYLWLAEAYLSKRDQYEFLQGSRVIPFFKAIGRNRGELEQVGGLTERVSRFVMSETDSPDSGLFEILTAALYRRNGADPVSFFPPNPPEKAPDLKVSIFGKEVFIECKRLSQRSQYSDLERDQWLRRWRPVGQWLASNRIPVCLNIVFHQELKNLPQDFLMTALTPLLTKVRKKTVLREDDKCTVTAWPVDMVRIRKHVEGHYVKYPSSAFIQLVTGEYRRHGGFTFVMEAKTGHFEGSSVLNKYILDIKFVAGASWTCDAPRAIESKARDIRGHLSEAFEQIPQGELGNVHVGIESNDGWDVEQERIERVFRTAMTFDPRGKRIEWLYVHLFEPESPPDEDWAIDETVSCFGAPDPRIPRLEDRPLVVPGLGRPGFPWDGGTPRKTIVE